MDESIVHRSRIILNHRGVAALFLASKPTGERSLGLGSLLLDSVVYLVDARSGLVNTRTDLVLCVFAEIVELVFALIRLRASVVDLWICKREPNHRVDKPVACLEA